LESEQVLENVICVNRSGVQGELRNSQVIEDISGDKVGADRSCPCQGDGGEGGSSGLNLVGAVGVIGPIIGPKVLRTRKGDLNLGNSICHNCSGQEGVLLANGIDFGSKAQFPESARKASSRKEIAKAQNHNGSKPKRDNRKGMPNLPFNKFNKFPGFGQHATKRKKSSKGGTGDKEALEIADSDSIHNSDIDPEEQIEVANGSSGIVLEVVLPGTPAPVAVSAPLPGRAVSGMDSFLNVVGEANDQDRQTV
jgi:hypothetical protein